MTPSENPATTAVPSPVTQWSPPPVLIGNTEFTQLPYLWRGSP